MTANSEPADSIVGPLGERLTVESLPSRGTVRWVVRRKAQVVAAVKGGLLSLDEVCDRYAITIEEYASWQRAFDRSGLPGLRVTKRPAHKAHYAG